MKFLFSCVFILTTYSLKSQSLIDVQHYRYEIELTDKSDTVYGKATIKIKAAEPVSQFDLDLQSVVGKTGMHVQQLLNGSYQSNLLRFRHKGEKLTIQFADTVKANEIRDIVIIYKGIPKDGLIISKNKWGDRTFFADHWPNRAHQWIPCIDVPDDKASFEFLVTAPSHYRVISNGVLIEETSLNNGKTRTHWKETIPLSTKIMVIGVARFAVKTFSDSPPGIPVSAWVYPQDSSHGFKDYAPAVEIIKFFSNYIAPYPYQKLANVQSTTIFGGMENASAIFYNEHAVTGRVDEEDVIAHEIAHQWFGDMASEKSFEHLWLSEGFATFFENLYIENKYGKDSAGKCWQQDREKVIAFNRQSKKPVVDSTKDLMSLLNANSYQKGAWVLQMLRNEVGEEGFKKIIQSYYQQFKGKNAETRDLTKLASFVMKEDLRPFFHQWLYNPGIPKLKMEWKHTANQLKVKVQQQQKNLYRFPLEIQIWEMDGTSRIVKLNINKLTETIVLPSLKRPVKITLDPNTKLLFEGGVVQGK